jgi:hypothetical protein
MIFLRCGISSWVHLVFRKKRRNLEPEHRVHALRIPSIIFGIT